MTAVPFNAFVTYTNSSGDPLVGGKIFTYSAGTTTPLASYTDASGSTPATNPIILDANGRSPYGAIWLSGVYKLVLADSSGATIQTDDNITAAFGAGDMTKAVYDAANISQQVVGTTAVQTLTNKTVNGVTLTASGSASQFLNGAGAYAVPSAISSGTAVAASGTSVDFTGIPATAKRITVIFANISTNGTSNFLIQIGNGSVETSGYTSSAEYGGTAATSTVGFIIRNQAAASSQAGIFTICLVSTNRYVGSGVIRDSSGTGTSGAAVGDKSTSAAIDRVRITTVGGTDTFDNGTLNIFWE